MERPVFSKVRTVKYDYPKTNIIMVMPFGSPEALLWQTRQYPCGSLYGGLPEGSIEGFYSIM
jgi:hypothetical protein